MNSYKFKLVNWLANQFGYEITMVKMNKTSEFSTEEKSVVSLREKTKKYLESKLKKKQVIPVVETPVLTLRDKLRECGKL